MNLELMAMRWLWLEKNCHYIVEQRCPRYSNGAPDVMGITKSRFLIEIEIKRSVADFRADAKKPHRAQWRRDDDTYAKYLPKHIFYLMPKDLAEKLLPEIPEWAGLLCNGRLNYTCEVLKDAPTNPKSQRLSLKECVKATRHMVNHMMTLKQTMFERQSNWKHRDDLSYVDWVDVENGTHEI